MPPEEVPGPPPPLRTRGRQATVVLGFLLTVLGAFIASGLLPSSPGDLERALPYLAGGLSLLWVGGSLMGFALGRRRSTR